MTTEVDITVNTRHEIVGEVTEVWSKVTKFKVGDRVGVGCIVGSWVILTSGAKYHDGTITYGGYSDWMVADEHFVVLIPDNLPLDVAAPLLCAGISVYCPLRYYGLDKPSLHIGVVGLGGLGHLAVRFAKAMGTKVTVISSSPNKKKEAMEILGADSFLAAMGTMDSILDTVSAKHPLLSLLELLKKHGKLFLVGAPTQAHELPAFARWKLVGGSVIGGMKGTQEMLDFAAKHNVKPKIEVVAIDYVNTTIHGLEKTNVKYRFVIDIENTLKPSSK
ncbi:hypothetical protein ES332_D11G241100v1 [Gossypium tomentosum]|uniref:Uncharacterized protein n=1 Tax=Gossypium tomentosum TaxID=34277 RepID=A0A5D2IR75_GOSTO|nr:hypothetical protein ES332_D11G241100v1 [Gossypium tomentosum]